RENRIGAYYRINHRLADFHAAINETGAIFCSANVHAGWSKAEVKVNSGVIPFYPETPRPTGHAFALIGYNENGFIVQNSWGSTWGKGGTAIWTYEDWFENIRDGWAFRLSLSTKAIWQISTREKPRATEARTQASPPPVRSEIAGHFVHINDGEFHRHGSYWSDINDVEETSQLLAQSEKYDHLLIYAHGGLNSPKDAARRIRAMAPVFKKNRIYPYHFMYDTGLAEEIKDIISRKLGLARERVGGISNWTDVFIEKALRAPGRSVWREMKFGAISPFDEEHRAGWQTLALLIGRLLTSHHPKKVHLVGHSTGALLLAYLLEALEILTPGLRMQSVSLMAPASTIELYRSHYHPLLRVEKRFFGINKMVVYNLTDELEQKDSVAKLYRKSLLYLVSRAFEEDTPEALLGMQRYSTLLDRRVGKTVDFVYSHGSTDRSVRSAASTHGGFDNDPLTLNDILKSVLGKKPQIPFRNEDLTYGLALNGDSG
ncbi:MAG: peptidase C1, partial [Gammaproteobacteria bacterium]|nr:peptidase C1 [Gammaproteobacteria bacterium]